MTRRPGAGQGSRPGLTQIYTPLMPQAATIPGKAPGQSGGKSSPSSDPSWLLSPPNSMPSTPPHPRLCSPQGGVAMAKELEPALSDPSSPQQPEPVWPLRQGERALRCPALPPLSRRLTCRGRSPQSELGRCLRARGPGCPAAQAPGTPSRAALRSAGGSRPRSTPSASV